MAECSGKAASWNLRFWPSMWCLKAIWEFPEKLGLFCGFWENLEHSHQEDECLNSKHQTNMSICPFVI